MNHPAGRIGRRLTLRVADVMLTGRASMPLVRLLPALANTGTRAPDAAQLQRQNLSDGVWSRCCRCSDHQGHIQCCLTWSGLLCHDKLMSISLCSHSRVVFIASAAAVVLW